MERPKLLATGLLVAVFTAGIAVGGAVSALADRTTDDEDDRDSRRRSFIEWLETEMTLDGEQQAAIREVLEQYNAEMDSLWTETRPRTQEIRIRARAAISDALTEEQRAIYAQMNARVDSIRAERRNKHDKKR